MSRLGSQGGDTDNAWMLHKAGYTLLFGYDQDQLDASRVGDPCLIGHIIIIT